jgi:hypothetical protein
MITCTRTKVLGDVIPPQTEPVLSFHHDVPPDEGVCHRLMLDAPSILQLRRRACKTRLTTVHSVNSPVLINGKLPGTGIKIGTPGNSKHFDRNPGLRCWFMDRGGGSCVYGNFIPSNTDRPRSYDIWPIAAADRGLNKEHMGRIYRLDRWPYAQFRPLINFFTLFGPFGEISHGACQNWTSCLSCS